MRDLLQRRPQAKVLHQYRHEDSSNRPDDYEDKAYSLTSPDQYGTVGLYVAHTITPTSPNSRTDYVVTQPVK
jgi:hypothetical protein